MTRCLALPRVHGRLACGFEVGDLEVSYKMEPSSAGVSVTRRAVQGGVDGRGLEVS